MKAVKINLSALILFLGITQVMKGSGVSSKQNEELFTPCVCQFKTDSILIGSHYGDMSNHEGRNKSEYPLNIWPFFCDYVKYMKDDMLKTSYADFWRWWYVLERYKGDEKGLAELEAILDKCTDLKLKTKIVLCWSTWWALDKDWEQGCKLPWGPEDVDDWTHLLLLLSDRYRGKVAMWDLQGEANDIKGYWGGVPMEHIYQIYKRGYIVLEDEDPGSMVGIGGASPSVSRERLDKWYISNIENCKGYFDSIPINYFADVADPYKGAINMHSSIRGMLDAEGLYEAEIGMGESSVQWAETTEKAGRDGLSQYKQAETMNMIFGELFTRNMNKFIFWTTEFAPDGGWWPWRWGIRNYQDWWGIWPDNFKVAGTQIVYRRDAKDGKTYDLRKNWARPADPYYPAGEVFDFWCQLAPSGSESIRLDMKLNSRQPDTAAYVGAYQQAFDKVVALVYHKKKASAEVILNTRKTGWGNKIKINVNAKNELIDFNTGIHSAIWSKNYIIEPDKDRVSLNLPKSNGFTTIHMTVEKPEYMSEEVGKVFPDSVETGDMPAGYIILKNVGASKWSKSKVKLAPYSIDNNPASRQLSEVSFRLDRNICVKETVAIPVKLPGQNVPGLKSYSLRLTNGIDWFGPMFCISTNFVDTKRPRKLVAHREQGHIKIQWFAPIGSENIKYYELYRSERYKSKPDLIQKIDNTEYADRDIELDKAYYYYVIAVDNEGNKSRPSVVDNAKAISKPRIYDAEVVKFDVPAKVRVGDLYEIKITFRNTGKKTWDLSNPSKIRYWVQTTRLWGISDEKRLPYFELKGSKTINPAQTVTASFPFVGPKPGRYENHWILRMEVPDGKNKNGLNGPVQYAYFGTPLLKETIVTSK